MPIQLLQSNCVTKNFVAQKSTLNNTTPDKKEGNVSPKKKFIIGTGAIVTSGLAIAYFVKTKKTMNVPPQTIIKPPTEQVSQAAKELMDTYKKIIQKFPKDEPYYKSLAKSIGLKSGEEYKLVSITGEHQLSEILKNATPQDFAIGENLSGVKNRTLRINLHNHTTVSDGKLTPAEILEQARKWADEIVTKQGKGEKTPFVFGITDHDSIDGAKEIVNLISKSPEKYKNLKIVLGGEFSVAHTNPNDVKSPMNFELIGYGLDPFNKQINNFLQNIRAERKKYVQKYIDIIQKELPQYNFNIKETENFHANLRNMRTNGVLYLTREYLTHKMFLTKYVDEINSKILSPSDKKLDANKIFEKLGDEFYTIKDAKGYDGEPIPTYYKEYVFKNLLTNNNTAEFETVLSYSLPIR